jgi:hypothetical protein
MTTERRRFVRYKVAREAIYVISRDPDMGGWLKNISKGGVAFEYHPSPGSRMGPKSIISLSGHHVAFYLTGVPCALIYDIQSIEENQTFSGQESRLCGWQYGELSKRQEETLTSILKKMSKT